MLLFEAYITQLQAEKADDVNFLDILKDKTNLNSMQSLYMLIALRGVSVIDLHTGDWCDPLLYLNMFNNC